MDYGQISEIGNNQIETRDFIEQRHVLHKGEEQWRLKGHKEEVM